MFWLIKSCSVFALQLITMTINNVIIRRAGQESMSLLQMISNRHEWKYAAAGRYVCVRVKRNVGLRVEMISRLRKGKKLSKAKQRQQLRKEIKNDRKEGEQVFSAAAAASTPL